MTDANRLAVEAQYGAAPTSAEAHSLWLTAISPLPAHTKYSLLVSRNTAFRYEQCLAALRELVVRINRRAALLSSATAIASNAASLTASGFAAFTNLVYGAAAAATGESESQEQEEMDFFGGTQDSASSDDEGLHSAEVEQEEEEGEFLDVEFSRDSRPSGQQEDEEQEQEIEFSPDVVAENSQSGNEETFPVAVSDGDQVEDDGEVSFGSEQEQEESSDYIDIQLHNDPE